MTQTNNGIAARHSSATAEHYTPPHIVEASRATLGRIDLDPFSCAKANETVRAGAYSTEGGFDHDWHGRVFVNPPGGKTGNESNQRRAWFKLDAEHASGRVSAAVFVCFSVELLQVTQSRTPPGARIPLDFPICYPSKRIAYIRDDGQVGASPPHSSCVIYLPPKASEREVGIAAFCTAFATIGRVVVPARCL